MNLQELQEMVNDLCDGLYLLELTPGTNDKVLLENLRREATELCKIISDFRKMVYKNRKERI